MLQQDGRQLTPTEAFITDITKWLEEGKKKGELFIVGGDFNEVLKIGSTLLKLCTNKTVPLVDSLASKERDNKNSFLSGQTIIDYVFVSPELLPAIRRQGYNRFDQLIITDPRGMFIDFDTEMLFGNGDLKLANKKMRYIQAKDPYMVKEYIDAMYEHLENQNVWQLYSQLISKEHLNAELAERVEKILTDASLVAESKCKFRQKNWWSVPLAKAKFKLYTLKTHLSQLRCDITVPTRTTKYGVTDECPPDIKTTQTQLSKIQREIKTIMCNSQDKRVEYNKTIASINAITGRTTKEKVLKAIVNAEEMAKVWTKIGHADKKYESGLITSFQIPVTWPSSNCD